MDTPPATVEYTINALVGGIRRPVGANNPCYLCARMRRGHLYHQAEVLGCNKIALGHHFDDVIETILMSMIYGGQSGE